MTINYKVSGVGEVAVWVISECYLATWVGDKTFQIAANIGDNKETNKKLAVALAQEVIRKCK
jgi:hypothetical protein